MASLVQLVITGDTAELTAAALRDAANSEDVTVEEAGILYDASRLFQTASEEPNRFPLTGKMATSLPRALKRTKPNPNSGNTNASRRNKRKARQEKRAGWAKMRRKNRRQFAEEYNKAVAIMEAERAEMEVYEAEQKAKLADQPKFDIFAMDGTRILGEVPESMIRPVKDEAAPENDPAHQIILP